MIKRRVISVFEHERLFITGYNGCINGLTEKELNLLYTYNDRNNNKYFTGIRNGVKFTSYVGVIQIGSLIIEILPKADNTKDHTEENYTKWRSVLLNMLGVCKRITVNSETEALLDKRENSILDLYFQLFLDEVKELLHKGLIKQYIRRSGNIKALKGRLLFSKNIQHNLIHQERFYTEHQVYSYDHIYNQILYRAVNILSNIVTNSSLTNQINRIKLDFPEVTKLEVKATHFEKLVWGRKSEPYRRAIEIARLIILNYSPSLKSKDEQMLALLFNMNQLWEEYIYHLLLRVKQTKYQISYQNRKRFWENKTVRPDIVIKELSNNDNYVIDTKWKVIESTNPADDDLKQMFVYNIYWDASKSMMLYPQVMKQKESFGVFHKGRTEANSCKLGFLNIFDNENKLNLEAGKEVLSKLNL